MLLKTLYWFPRILAILVILFMMMLSLDAFEGHVPFSRQLLEFLVHNIPAFALIIVLITAWRFEIIGGAVLPANRRVVFRS
jgi:hypothetical protein